MQKDRLTNDEIQALDLTIDILEEICSRANDDPSVNIMLARESQGMLYWILENYTRKNNKNG